MKNKTILFCLLLPLSNFSQTGDDSLNILILNHYENSVEVARNTIKLVSGFTTTSHTNFRAYINPDLPYNGGTPVTNGEFNKNYIRIFTPLGNNATDSVPSHNGLNYTLWSETIEYYDGLGRLSQKINVKESPGGGDIVLPVKYDDLGRQINEYLPYVICQSGNNGPGGYRQEDLTEQVAFNNYMYESEGQYAKNTTEFDNSPLNRIFKVFSPGADWNNNGGHPVKYEYQTNNAGEVYLFKVTEYNELKKDGCYQAGKLFKNLTYDENNHAVTEYRDFADRVILKKVENDGGDLSTYYVYDDFGLLRYVLPPETYPTIIEGSSIQVYPINAGWILNYCFYYQYDGRKRMITKRLPGVEPVYLVYNKRDQLVATQDGNMRSPRKWLFTKYDVFNRPVMTGMYQHNTVLNQSQMQEFVDTDDDYFESPGNPYHGYSNDAFPDITSSGCEVYTVTYYDDYDYVELPGFNDRYEFQDNEVFMYEQATNVKGQITATKTRILPNSEITPSFSNSYLISAIYYDEYLRVIQTISDNHRSGLDIVSNRINFTGDVLLTKENHTTTGAPVIVQHEFSYDNGKRLTKTKHKINDQYQLTLSEQKYEETGRLKRKYLQKTTTALQTLDYRYNIRGWLTDINDVSALGNDKFAMKLSYTTLNPPQYNGNIASMQWNTAMFNTQEYQFEYDMANRLKSASSSQGTGNYSTSYIYDKNGNLLNLYRQGKIEGENNYGYIDKLIYYYTGNKLKCVNDWYDDDYQNNGFSDNGSFSTTTPEFIYDANGNMLSDQNKDLDSIAYNYLNLPQQIYLATDGFNEINYLYTANGQKLMKQTRTENGREQTVDYIGNFVYEDGTLTYLLTDEGRVLVNSDPSYEYQYFLKDHLGNTRITFKQNGQIIQEDAYYPFGMQMNGLCYQSGIDYENKYLYNGKELQDDFGLDWYDYGARMYDAVIGRWHTVDPVTENHYDFTPYNYVLNNPLSYVDPKGMDTLRVSSSFKMTTGKFGLKGKVFGAVGYGLEYCFGGAEQEVELYLEVDTDTWDINIGAKHTQRYIEKGSNSAALGIFHGGVSEEKEIVNDINIKEGSSRTEDKKYEKKESGGIGPVTTEETKEGITVKGDMGVGGEINALIFGVGAGVSVDYIPTKSTPQKEDKERK